jgi:LysM repeat protein
MKRISFLLLTALLAAPVFSPAQDAATEERLNKLSAQIDVLIEAKDAQNKRIEELAKQLRDVQEQMNKPGNSASAEDVQKLADAIKQVDQKRKDDNEKVVQELQSLAKSLTGSSGRKTASGSGSGPNVPTTSSNNGPEKGYEYVVQQGDTIGAIVKAYRDKNIKVTQQQILNANPGLKPESMKVGQKIFIPAPQ